MNSIKSKINWIYIHKYLDSSWDKHTNYHKSEPILPELKLRNITVLAKKWIASQDAFQYQVFCGCYITLKSKANKDIILTKQDYYIHLDEGVPTGWCITHITNDILIPSQDFEEKNIELDSILITLKRKLFWTRSELRANDFCNLKDLEEKGFIKVIEDNMERRFAVEVLNVEPLFERYTEQEMRDMVLVRD